MFPRAGAHIGGITMSFDIENWERREIYEFFSSVDQPFYSVTFRLDVTKLTLDNDTFENTGKSRFFERRTSRVLY